MHQYLAWTHDAWTWLAGGPESAYLPLATLVVLVLYRAIGPGWLPHHPCPHCCWCAGGPPLGDRIEGRVRGRLGGIR